MSKPCFNKPALYFLITAFLFLQWSATHIHLAGEHSHDGSEHQHVVTAHQHQLAGHHVDAIDVAVDNLSHTGGNKVVELDHDCTQFHGKQGAQFTFIPAAIWHDFDRHISSGRVIPVLQQDRYQTYHQYTSIQLRAPPVIS